MKKILCAVVMAVGMFVGMGNAAMVDTFTTSWAVSNSTTNYLIADGKWVNYIQLMNLTTTYVNFEIKESSKTIDYEIVGPNKSVIFSVEDRVRTFTASLAANQPHDNGFNGATSSTTALGCVIRSSSR